MSKVGKPEVVTQNRVVELFQNRLEKYNPTPVYLLHQPVWHHRGTGLLPADPVLCAERAEL